MIPLLTLLGCAGERPASLGVTAGQLGTCPDSPNCVSSVETRDSHRIEPLTRHAGAGAHGRYRHAGSTDHQRTGSVSVR
jgi:uncharacterized protein (DUF1499 family)